MSNSAPTLLNGERGDTGSSWFNRLAVNLGFASGDARSTIEAALQEDDGGSLTSREREMLLRVLQLRELRLEDVMVPRANIVAIDESATLAELMGLFAKAKHSRIPVYSDTLDEPLGMAHVKDLMGWMAEHGSTAEGDGSVRQFGCVDLSTTIAASGIVRDVIFAPASMPALDLLARMQSRHIHLALVIDEHGGTDGLVSIEDLVEEVVGDIEDEHDISERSKIVEENGAYIVDARAQIDDVEARVGHHLTADLAGEVIDTVGGLIFAMLGRIPAPGEVIGHPSGYRFEILDADGRRVKRVRMRYVPADAETGADGDLSGQAA
jgi:CBS domain containing-hemolysin-like protein